MASARYSALLLAALIAADTRPAAAQRDTATLEPVVVTVTRGRGQTILRSPFALSVVSADSARPGLRHAGAEEMLLGIPGLASSSRNNPSQDPRLSIRGFGTRSAFGVRGVRVMRDGIPLTLPDGQTPLDYMSLESIGRIEVMRGSASALYGNATGGVIDVQTIEPFSGPVAVEGRQWIGADRYLRSVIAGSGTSGRLSFVADATRSSSDGTREHSRQRSALWFSRIGHSDGQGEIALTLLALDNPLSQNPGALTLEEMRADPRAADPGSVRRRARKAVRQLQLGLSAERNAGPGRLAASVFGGSRSLDNPLAFAVVEIGRHTWGGGVSMTSGPARHRISAGVDFQSQNDLRRNYFACADTVPQTAPTTRCPRPGSDRGAVTLDQREIVTSAGAYLSDEIAFSGSISATAGVRADHVGFRVRDRMISASNPDDSGERSLRAVSPILGIVARVAESRSLYANVSSAFETPTATELGNQPDGSAGINNELDPQKSLTLEIGSKGFAGPMIRYDLAAFRTSVRDELVPFEIPGSDGRRYFRNAGRTRRTGAEAGVEVSRGRSTAALAYTYSSFRFTEFSVGRADFGGNDIPGAPRHRAQAAMTFGLERGFVVLEGEAAGSSYADDANTFRAPGYGTFHLRGGLRGSTRAGRFSVTAGIQNVLDRTYASSIAVNAARGRYFEPAQTRTLFVGVALGVTRK